MTAKIDGKTLSAALAYFVPGDVDVWVVVMGFTNDGRAIEFRFEPPASLPRTYTLASDSANGGVTIATNPQDPNTYVNYDILDNSGSLTITVLTANNCQGTFSLKARGEKTGKVINVTKWQVQCAKIS